MSGEYVVIENGKIVEHCCGLLQKERDCRKVPDGFSFNQGADIRNYDSSWSLRPLIDRVRDGLVSVSKEEKIVGENIVALDWFERIVDGIDPLPKGQKLSCDRTALEPMTIQEQVQTGQITEATGAIIQAITARAERDAILAGCDWTQTSDCPFPDDLKAAWRIYRQTLRDIPEQGGFPWMINWPIAPSGVIV